MAELVDLVETHYKTERFGVVISNFLEVIGAKSQKILSEPFWKESEKKTDHAQLSAFLMQMLWIDFQRSKTNNFCETTKFMALPDLFDYFICIHAELTFRFPADGPTTGPFLSYMTHQAIQLILKSKGVSTDKSPRTTEKMRSASIFFLADFFGDILSMPDGKQLLSKFQSEVTYILREFVGPLNQLPSFAGKEGGLIFSLLCGAYEVASGRNITGISSTSPKNVVETLHTVVNSFIEELNELKAAIIESNEFCGSLVAGSQDANLQLSSMEDSGVYGKALETLEPFLHVG